MIHLGMSEKEEKKREWERKMEKKFESEQKHSLYNWPTFFPVLIAKSQKLGLSLSFNLCSNFCHHMF